MPLEEREKQLVRLFPLTVRDPRGPQRSVLGKSGAVQMLSRDMERKFYFAHLNFAVYLTPLEVTSKVAEAGLQCLLIFGDLSSALHPDGYREVILPV